MTYHKKSKNNSTRLRVVVPVGFGAILTMMVVIGIVSKLTMNTLVGAVGWVTHTYQVEGSLKELEKHLLDAETGQRGFIFTGKEEFLDPYNNGKRDLKERFEEIKRLISDNPEQLKRLSAIEGLTQKKLDELAETISLKRAGKEAELKALVLSGQGKQIMDETRTRIAEMVSIEDALLAQRKQSATQAEQLSTNVSLGGTSAAVILGGIIIWMISRWVVRPLNSVATTIATSSTEIAAAVEQQERIASQQAASVNQTTTTMDELNASSQQSATQAEGAAEGAKQVLGLAQGGTYQVNQTLEGMTTLKLKVGEIADQILRLSEQTAQIGSISSLVSDLANQTNMLALNAAVEAARAGEHGKGFAVVATEIRKLADQSKKSGERINALVTDIQGAINTTVMVTDEGTKNVETGMKLVQSSATAFIGVADAIQSIVLNSQQISLTAKQQSIAIQQVVDAMNALNETAVQTASGIRQTQIGTQRLKDAALDLESVV